MSGIAKGTVAVLMGWSWSWRAEDACTGVWFKLSQSSRKRNRWCINCTSAFPRLQVIYSSSTSSTFYSIEILSPGCGRRSMDSIGDRVVETGGGATFHGDLAAARDINKCESVCPLLWTLLRWGLDHFTTQIKQTIQDLSQRCETRDISEGLRTKISTLRSIAETTEDHARALQADVSMNEPRLRVSLLECKDVLIELQNLARSIEGGEEGSALKSVETIECNSVVTDLRGRLSSIQACLSGYKARKLREDHILIKEAL